MLHRHRAILAPLAVVGLAFLALDWSRLVLLPADLSLRVESNALKVLACLLCAVLAWRATGHGLGGQDERRLRVIFALIFAADVCFVTALEPIGIVLFGVVQVLLTRRSLTGARAARARLTAAAPRLAGIGVATALALGVTLAGIHALQGVTPLLAVIGVYVTLLWASVVAAWAAREIGYFPAENTRLMALGMTLFLLCDITVAGNLALPAGHLARVVTESLTWMFYGPALLLLALSGWRHEPVPLATGAAPVPHVG